MKILHQVSFILLVIGGLNWLVFALSTWDIGQLFGGMDSRGATIVYGIVGIAALYEAITHGSRCKECTAKSNAPQETSV